jgi:capsid protein
MIASPHALSAPPSISGDLTPAEKKQFSYDAAESSTKRKTATIHRGNEDSILGGTKRDQGNANVSDLARNLGAVLWAVRRHLDYVTDFGFQARHTDRGLVRDLREWEANWSEPEEFDASERFDRDNYTRLVEASSVLQGDFGTLKMADGRVAAIEGDRVRNLNNRADEEDSKKRGTWWHGVLTNKVGKHLAYRVHARQPRGGFKFEREIPAHDVVWHSQLGRYDQVRGISPIISAANDFRDFYENIDIAKVKSKVANLFALALYRDAETAILPTTANSNEDGGYNITFNKGPMLLDLDPGDKAEFLDSNIPSPEFQQFMTLVMMLALKSLDIPFSFFNESFTNFFGSKSALLHYMRACRPKRRKIRRHLRKLAAWRLAIDVEDGNFLMPSGMSFDELLRTLHWNPTGTPWGKPSEEIGGDKEACGAGFTSPQRVCLERDTGEFFEILDEIELAIKGAADRGIVLNLDGSAMLAQALNDDDPMPDPPEEKPAPAKTKRTKPAKKQAAPKRAAQGDPKPLFG